VTTSTSSRSVDEDDATVVVVVMMMMMMMMMAVGRPFLSHVSFGLVDFVVMVWFMVSAGVVPYTWCCHSWSRWIMV
jgi:hypothetical protein